MFSNRSTITDQQISLGINYLSTGRQWLICRPATKKAIVSFTLHLFFFLEESSYSTRMFVYNLFIPSSPHFPERAWTWDWFVLSFDEYKQEIISSSFSIPLLSYSKEALFCFAEKKKKDLRTAPFETRTTIWYAMFCIKHRWTIKYIFHSISRLLTGR